MVEVCTIQDQLQESITAQSLTLYKSHRLDATLVEISHRNVGPIEGIGLQLDVPPNRVPITRTAPEGFGKVTHARRGRFRGRSRDFSRLIFRPEPPTVPPLTTVSRNLTL
jgi:hypothetical protein